MLFLRRLKTGRKNFHKCLAIVINIFQKDVRKRFLKAEILFDKINIYSTDKVKIISALNVIIGEEFDSGS